MARRVLTVREGALRLLARREHSRGELRRKLRGKFGGEFAGEIEEVLGDLEGRGLLSDLRFARAYAREVAGRFAAGRVRAELRKREVGEEEIEAALGELGEEDELSRARGMVERRRGGGSERGERERVRLIRWLAGRGFSLETAKRAVEEKD